MSTTARKARKRSGEKFTRKPKEATPLEARSIRMVVKKTPVGPELSPSNRHRKKIQDAIKIRDMDKSVVMTIED